MDVFLQEYSSDEAVRRYTSRTAGVGIDYLLDHEYADVYRGALDALGSSPSSGLRILEFGCGGGMNLLRLVKLLARYGRRVETAWGTDFSPRLIEAAKEEAKLCLSPEDQKKVGFHVARNEALAADLAASLGVAPASLHASVHLILGVNTFRYCHRLKKTAECARDIHDLLVPGGVCVMIDMNGRFPAFRSRLRDRMSKPASERYLPVLREYEAPFKAAGLDIVRRTTFCWIPHSAGPRLLGLCRALTPLLNAVARPWAMRCLVLARKPPAAGAAARPASATP